MVNPTTARAAPTYMYMWLVYSPKKGYVYTYIYTIYMYVLPWYMYLDMCMYILVRMQPADSVAHKVRDNVSECRRVLCVSSVYNIVCGCVCGCEEEGRDHGYADGLEFIRAYLTWQSLQC